MTFMPNAASRCATRMPIRPRPTMPTVFSYSSTPVYLLRFHSPPLSDLSAAGTRRAAASSSATASSAALTMFEVGALTTITPAWVAALTSTLSRPTPARATTFRRRAAASASASTLVAERTRMASTSAIASSSCARSAPSVVRISKSGPSASTVAGDSSSAISTTGRAVTGAVSVAGMGFLSSQAARQVQSTALCPLMVDGTGSAGRARAGAQGSVTGARPPRGIAFACRLDTLDPQLAVGRLQVVHEVVPHTRVRDLRLGGLQGGEGPLDLGPVAVASHAQDLGLEVELGAVLLLHGLDRRPVPLLAGHQVVDGLLVVPVDRGDELAECPLRVLGELAARSGELRYDGSLRPLRLAAALRLGRGLAGPVDDPAQHRQADGAGAGRVGLGHHADRVAAAVQHRRAGRGRGQQTADPGEVGTRGRLDDRVRVGGLGAAVVPDHRDVQAVGRGLRREFDRLDVERVTQQPELRDAARVHAVDLRGAHPSVGGLDGDRGPVPDRRRGREHTVLVDQDAGAGAGALANRAVYPDHGGTDVLADVVQVQLVRVDDPAALVDRPAAPGAGGDHQDHHRQQVPRSRRPGGLAGPGLPRLDHGVRHAVLGPRRDPARRTRQPARHLVAHPRLPPRTSTDSG